LIGILGMLLPIVCYLGGRIISGQALGPSISHYYYTSVRDVFVGILISVAMFLVSYRGYKKIESLVSSITGAAALGIALFPCFTEKMERVGFFQLPVKVSNTCHVICAGLFFLLLAINAIFIFTMTSSQGNVTDRKKKRNIIYVASGIVILVCLSVLWYLGIKFEQGYLNQKNWVFYLESVLLEAFGISWLVKGETILRDK
jgi:uncharacterized protein YacL